MQSFAEVRTVVTKPLHASFKVAYRIARCKIPHLIGHYSVLPAAVDTAKSTALENSTCR
jgi:hypothetical protein